MVEYADRDFYENTFHGEIIPEKAFHSMILKASIFVKFLTFSRVDDMTEIPEEVSLATCAIADVMYQDGMRKDDAGREIASENNDGYSVSFVTSQSKTTGTVEHRCKKAAYPYLAHTGLLYRGCGPYDDKCRSDDL